MTPEQFFKYIEYPELLDDRSLAELDELLKEYPYFQSARLLYVKNLKNQGSIKYDRELRRTAIWVTDRRKLFYLLDERVLLPVSASDEFESKTEVVLNKADTEEIDFSELSDVTNFEDAKETERERQDEELDRLILSGSASAGTFFNVDDKVDLDEFKDLFAKNKPKKEEFPKEKKVDRRGSLIDTFIKTQPRIVPKEINEQPSADFSTGSSTVNNEVLTDTLAKIYIKQGLYEKAITAYEKLSLKYPEKNSYFASQIQNIKKLINNQ